MQACVACHSPDGNSSIPDNPKLAGLHAAYVVKQLSDFKRGVRKSPIMNAVMTSVAEEDFKEIAAYFSAQKRTRDQATDASLLPHGKTIYSEGIAEAAVPACANCHNEDGSGTAKYPRLAAQHQAYVIRQLLAFKSGERSNDMRAVMSTMAKRTNEQEIRAVAEYIATLPGTEP